MQDKGKKYELFCTALDSLDRGTALINAYDALLHDYGGVVLFQAESQTVSYTHLDVYKRQILNDGLAMRNDDLTVSGNR